MLHFWYEAASSPLGIEISVSNPERALAKLYAARKEACDPILENISIVRLPSKPNVLWLVKKEKPDAKV